MEENLSELSEEELLNRAIAASLAENSVTPGSPSTAPDDYDAGLARSPRDEKKAVKGDESVEKDDATRREEPVSRFDTIQAIKREEPSESPSSTRIQLRLTDGTKKVRRFMKTDPVRYLFEYVKAEVETTGQEFEASERMCKLDMKLTPAVLFVNSCCSTVRN